MKKLLKETVIPLSAILLAFILFGFVFVSFWVPSGSMENTIPANSWGMGCRLSYISDSPENGDVIVFMKEDVTSTYLIKRVCGVAGQTVSSKDGTVYIDGVAIDGEYTEDFDEVTVPDVCVFVLGDNRDESNDSRYWENPFVSVDDVIAKAYFVFFPKLIKLF